MSWAVSRWLLFSGGCLSRFDCISSECTLNHTVKIKEEVLYQIERKANEDCVSGLKVDKNPLNKEQGNGTDNICLETIIIWMMQIIREQMITHPHHSLMNWNTKL